MSGATASPQPAGHASHGACFTSPPCGDHQAQGCANDLQKNADALEAWFKSMDSQRADWTYHQGVETTARDALEGVYRLAVSVVQGLRDAASAIEARSDATTEIGTAEGESAAAKPDAQGEQQ